ncbi:15477_t:CDS:1 [Acaulospora morrowiae]|uniref:15477_t:CDS:1 n=1 Tax=Acaulospora morrowiae TaxID=94023 RepID=A0A9N8W343_9GLOM|nr:15477_t:CDS:1 [Acaulospora morrowiae]
MALVHFIIYCGISEIQSDIESQAKRISSSQPITKPFKDTWKLMILTWHHLYITLLQKNRDCKNKATGNYYDIHILHILLAILFFPIYIICAMPLGIMICVIFYIPFVSNTILVFWNKYSSLNRRMKMLMFIPVVLATIISPIIVTIEETVVMTGVWYLSVLAMWVVANEGFVRGFDVLWWVIVNLWLHAVEIAGFSCIHLIIHV